jgi:hypothetical protein
MCGSETKPPVSAATVAAIRAALEKAGIEFIEENGGGPGVRLKKGKEKKGERILGQKMTQCYGWA